jgi:exoribonuclease R
VIRRLVRAPRIDFSGLRQELQLPAQYPAAAAAEAAQAAVRAKEILGDGRADLTDLPFVTIDPATSRDLDQAVLLLPRDAGYRVHYAIADVAAFVQPTGVLQLTVR